MKLLLDENLPHDFRHFVAGHTCFTVAFMGWSGVKNGELLARAASQELDAVLTLDSGFAFQQSVANLPIAIVVLAARSNRLDDLIPLVPRLLDALASLIPRSITRVA